MSLKNKIYVKPEKSRLINLLDDIKSGRIRIPVFQRDYVWKKNQRVDLLDSLNNGFPIGSLLFWRPHNLEFKFNEKIGPFHIKYESSNYSYVLDGFQRVSTLFGALTNPNSYNGKVDPNITDYVLHYDLKEEEFIQVRGKEEIYQIPLYKLIDTFEFLSFSENLRSNIEDIEQSSKYINNAKKLANQLLDYEIPYVEIIGGEIEDAVEIFHRVNSKGSDISPIWMLNALTYVENKFRFNDKIVDLREKLEKYNFHDIPVDIILHCIETSTGKIYFDVNLQSLSKRKDFPILVEDTFINIEKAVRFLYEKVNVFESKILPYNLQLIFITEFFRLNKKPSDLQLSQLERWFWITSYANYFSIFSLSKQRIAFEQFQRFCEGEISNPVYNDDNRQRFKTLDFPIKISYGSVRSKCLALFMIRNYLIFNNTYDDSLHNDFEFKYIVNKIKKAEMALPIDKNKINFELGPKKNITSDFFFRIKDNQNLLRGYFLDESFILFYANNNVNEMIKHRRELIIRAESTFVESIGLEYFGIDNYDYIKDIPMVAIANNCKLLDWDFENQTVSLDSIEGHPFFFDDIEQLVNILDEIVISDVLGEMPLYVLKEHEGIYDYSEEIRDYLMVNYFAEMTRIGWDVLDL